jgi:predicted RecB family nuclease
MATALRQVTPARGGRYYELADGTRYPSVTSILQVIGKPALINWAANVERTMVTEAAANLYADLPLDAPRMNRLAFLATLASRVGQEKAHEKAKVKAGEIGSEAHARVEWEIRTQLGQKAGPEPMVQGPALWAFMAFQDWWKEAGLRPVFLEQSIYSQQYGYAGTMDLLAKDPKGELVIVDFKTSKAIYPEAYLQTAAYAQAVNEMGHGPVGNGIIVRLPKAESDPGFEAKPIVDLFSHFTTFLNAFELWKWQQEQDALWRESKA